MEMTANFSTFAFTFWDVSSVPSTRDHTHEFFVLGMLAQSRLLGITRMSSFLGC
jgi:hypothetical protein